MTIAFTVDEWVRDAACGTHPDPELWFGNNRGGYRKAIAICNRCPVKAECLAEALDGQIAYGVWGGLTATDRAKLARCRRCGQPAPAVDSNPTRVRGYCGAECRYAAARERLLTRVVPLRLPPQPIIRHATCFKCGDQFKQERAGRPALTCPDCRPNRGARRRTGEAS